MDEAKYKLILPTLLCNKLVDSYVTLSETLPCANLGNNKALMGSIGIMHNLLTAGHLFAYKKYPTFPRSGHGPQ